MRAHAQLGDFFHLQVDEAIDDIVGEDAACLEEITVSIELGQGYYYSRPIPAEQLLELLAEEFATR